MLTVSLLPQIKDIQVDSIISGSENITLNLSAISPTSCCPLCGQVSQIIHARYSRTITDLPWSRVTIRIHLQARKFKCQNPQCQRRIFTEPLTELVARYARKTNRLQEALYLIGYVLGGEAGARMAVELGLHVSPDTLLHQIRKGACSSSSSVRVLGVDDFAFRRGCNYGTILVDLESRRLLDLLPDRLSTTLSAWLKNHPEVEVISRDRAECYREGASKGAPNALQVTDRWHLLKNIAERLEDVFNQERSILKEAACRAYPRPPLAPALPNYQQRQKLQTVQNRQARLDKYQAIFAQNSHLSPKDQIKAAGISRNTYYKWIDKQTLSERKALPRRDRLIDEFTPYLLARWNEGCHNGPQLFAEIQGQGFTGTYCMLTYALRQWRPEVKQKKNLAPVHQPSPRESVWYLLKSPLKRTPEQQRYVDALLELSPQLCKASELALSFFTLVRNRDVAGFENWLKAIGESDIMPLKACLGGMLRDKSAIIAALSCEWSNGQVEGQVNRLKLVKRSMYGRASLDLLRARVLPMRRAA